MKNKLKELRILRNMTIEETAIALNLPKTTYYNYESGRNQIDRDLLVKISKFYNVSIDELLKNSSNQYSIPAYTLSEHQKTLFDKIKNLSDSQCIALQGIIDSFLESKDSERERQNLETYLKIKQIESGDDEQ